MAMQNWKSFLMPYEQAVDELKIKLKSIRKEYRKRNEYSPIEFVTGRVKEVSSLLEKANKFGIPLDRVGQEMEDIAGIRIMSWPRRTSPPAPTGRNGGYTNDRPHTAPAGGQRGPASCASTLERGQTPAHRGRSRGQCPSKARGE